jgi:phosphoadenosine phosphosulfate reductase
MLIENTLFGDVDKEANAVALLRKHQPTEPYWLAFSGGKDSIVILKLAELAGVRFEAHYNRTTVDPPEVLQHTKQHYPQVKFDKPKRSMFQWILKKGLPLRQNRWCCEKLKERNPPGKKVIRGLRYEESFGRKDRQPYEQNRKDKSVYFVHPILNWNELDVWEFIKKYRKPYPALYDEGFDRIGCILCPNNSHVEMHKKRWPKMVNAYKRAAIKYWERGTKGGKRFKSGEEFFEWWLNRSASVASENQTILL